MSEQRTWTSRGLRGSTEDGGTVVAGAQQGEAARAGRGVRAPAAGLAGRLRRATADLHRDVEEAVDLPRSIRTRVEYVELLRRFLELHAPLEQRLATVAWGPRWTELGIDLARHRRTDGLVADLAALAAPARAGQARLPALATFGEGLGCLYVLEGSSLGGRVLAPALRRALGDVPLGFFTQEDRGHPGPWQAVRAALHRVDPRLEGEVVLGARGTFEAFRDHLGGLVPAGGCGR